MSSGILYIFALLAMSAAEKKCQFQITDFKLDPCNSTSCEMYDLKNLKVKLNEKCNIVVECDSTIKKDMDKIQVEFIGEKNGTTLARGKKECCGMDLFTEKIECPLTAGKHMVSNDEWIVENPYKAMLGAAVGKIKGTSKVMSSAGECCHYVEATVARV